MSGLCTLAGSEAGLVWHKRKLHRDIVQACWQ